MVVGAITATLILGVGTVAAAEIEVQPMESPAGPVELTLTVSGFAPELPIFAVPCFVTGDAADIVFADCDIAEVETAATDAEGRATLIVEWVLPPEGFTIYVGDEMRDHEVTATIAAVEEPTEDDAAPTDDPTDEAADAQAPPTEVGEVTVTRPDELADTGPTGVAPLVLVGVALIGAGALMTARGRRLAIHSSVD